MERGQRSAEPPPAGEVSLHICSIASSWPSTLRMVDTLRAINPDLPVTLLVLDAATDYPSVEGASVLGPEHLGLGDQELRELRLIYDRAELMDALIPRLLQDTLRRGADKVLFLGCHTEVHGSLHPIADALDRHPVVLSPRVRRPLPADGLAPDDRALLAQGAITTAQVALRASADEFLDWWIARTRWDAIHDAHASRGGASRWLDLAPALFDVEVLRDPGIAASPAGDDAHPLERHGDQWLVDGTSLITIDLAGFDPSQPALLDPDLGPRPRVLLSDRPSLRALLDDRRAALLASAVGEPEQPTPEVWLDARVRRMALAALRRAQERGAPPPFEVGPDHADLVRWLNDVIADPGAPVTRLMHAVWAGRGDLRAVFREPLGRDGGALAAWAASDPEFTSTYGEIHDSAARPRIHRASPSPGLNIVGFLNAELGLGEAARLVARAAAAAGVPFAPVAFRETESRQSVEFTGVIEAAPHDTTLLCVNADLTPLASAHSWGALEPDRHRIGYWFWEVDRFPPEQLAALHYVDELWTASRFVADTLDSITDKPVTVVPHPVAEPSPTHLSRRDIGLDDRFTFAFWFDAFSCTDRKNPAALIQAFCRAFTPGEGPVLLVKSINGDHDRAAMERLHWLAGDRSDILLVDGYRPAIEMRALVQHIDCYASLHRSEGFGQTMADAMMAAKPVIATEYSGNLQFMSDQNSLLVPYELVPVGHGNPPYPPDASWASPDVEAAASMMRWVVERPAEAAAMAARGAADVRRTNGLQVAGAHLATMFVHLLDRGVTA